MERTSQVKKSLPSRRELRLARQQQQALVITQEANATDLPFIIEQQEAATEIFASVSPDLETDKQARKAFNSRFSTQVKAGKNVIKNRIFRTSLAAVGGGAFVAALITASFAAANSAQGVQTLPLVDTILGAANNSQTSTPSSLLAENGLSDAARMEAAITRSANGNLRCVPTTGANSLLDVFVEESAPIYFPMPVGSYELTSEFGPRVDPITGWSRVHEGIDFAAPSGTPYYAVANGVVVGIGENGSGSNEIVIKHTIGEKTFYSFYLHSYRSGIQVTKGQEVKAGEHIGNVGSAGYSTGPHLHFEIREGATFQDKAVEPWSFIKQLGAVDLNSACQ